MRGQRHMKEQRTMGDSIPIDTFPFLRENKKEGMIRNVLIMEGMK